MKLSTFEILIFFKLPATISCSKTSGCFFNYIFLKKYSYQRSIQVEKYGKNLSFLKEFEDDRNFTQKLVLKQLNMIYSKRCSSSILLKTTSAVNCCPIEFGWERLK